MALTRTNGIWSCSEARRIAAFTGSPAGRGSAHRRNVIYAGDAGRGLVRVCEDGLAGERYLIAGENLAMSELMAKISKATGAPNPKLIPLPAARILSALQTSRYKYLGGPEPKPSRHIC
jgi:nucleoside-diphosphate-sugar epimerase